MDLTNVTKIFYNTPLIGSNTKVNGDNPIGVSIPTQTAGTLSILHTINQGSEIRISFSTVPSYLIDILRSTFEEGSLHNYDNNQYITTNYGETIDTQPLGQFGFISTFTVEVTLIVYSYLLAKTTVKLPYPSNGTSFISAQTIANKTGVQYNGFDFQIPVTKDNADTTFSFSLESEITQRLHEFQRVVDFNNQTVVTRAIGYTKPVIGEVSPIQISGSPPNQYKNAVVTWANNTLDPFRNDPTYMKPTPVVVYLIEGDLDVTKPPDSITSFKDNTGKTIESVGLNNPVNPKDGLNLESQAGTWYQACRVLHLVFDNGGQTKEVRITKKVDGVTEYVESFKYGFMFSAFRLASVGGLPQQYWLPIEYTKTTYFYEPVSRDFQEIKYQDRSGVWRTTIIDPTLKSLLQESNVSYLTRTETSGFKYMRFQQESFSNTAWDISKDSSIAGTIFWGKRLTGGINGGTGGNSTGEYNFCKDMLNLFLFRKVPIIGKTQYHLVESESVYNDTFVNTQKAIAANIEKVAWASLSEDLKIRTSPDSEGFVGIAKPDPDSYKEYLVISEKTEQIALAWLPNPLSIAYDTSQQTRGTTVPQIPTRSLPKTYYPDAAAYVVGENITNTVERKVIPNRNTTTKHSEVLQYNNRYKLPNGASINGGFTVVVGGTAGAINSNDRIDKYVEYNSNTAARGDDFQETASITTFSEVEGRPPLATVKRTQAVQNDIQKDPFFKTDVEYYYTSILDSAFPTEDGAGSFNLLEVKQSNMIGTKAAIDFKVKMENALNTKELTVDLGYYRPEYIVGNLTTVPSVLGQWLIRKVEHTFEFSGAFLVAKPTKLTLGKWYDIVSQITNSNFTKQDPTTLPYNPSKYNVVGTQYPLEFNKLQNMPSLLGDRGGKQPTLPYIEF